MKIRSVYLKERYKPPGETTPIPVIRARTSEGLPHYDIDFAAGFYTCRKGGYIFRVPVSNVIVDEPE